jgi:hypothetical protein
MALMVSIIAHTYTRFTRLYIGTIFFVLALARCAEPEEQPIPISPSRDRRAFAAPSESDFSVVREIEAAIADSARRGGEHLTCLCVAKKLAALVDVRPDAICDPGGPGTYHTTTLGAAPTNPTTRARYSASLLTRWHPVRVAPRPSPAEAGESSSVSRADVIAAIGALVGGKRRRAMRFRVGMSRGAPLGRRGLSSGASRNGDLTIHRAFAISADEFLA